MKATKEVNGNLNTITKAQVAVVKNGMGMNTNTGMDSAADSEMKYSHLVSVCRKHLNG
ncbi:MAG: hypothetical protein ACP5T7_09490 [bacterium]